MTTRFGRRIIDYRQLIAKTTEGYVGREWVRDAVDDFLKAGNPRYFLLLGEPGSGKTAFMADLVRRREYPHHFIGRGSRIDISSSIDWRNPIRFAESIGYQLLRDYGGWIMRWQDWGIHVSQKVKTLEGRLVGAHIGMVAAAPQPEDEPLLDVEQEVEQFGPAAEVIGVYIEQFVADVEQIVRQLLITPLHSIATRWPERQVVVVVDGLDEAARSSNADANIARMLPDAGLPPNVRFLLSSRPGEHLQSGILEHAQIFWLGEDDTGQRDARSLEDAEAFIDGVLREPSVQAIAHRHAMRIGALGKRVAAASQGNFLYLYHYAHGLRRGDARLLDLESLPVGLHGIYRNFIHEIKERRDLDLSWHGSYKPVLGTLAVAGDWLTRRQIADISGVSQDAAGTMLVELEEFLDRAREERGTRYTIYHASFAEYLVSEDNEDHIDARAAHARIATRLQEQCGDDPARLADDDYARRHIAAHLSQAHMQDALYRLISRTWMEARVRRDQGTYGGFLQDVDLALKAVDQPVPLARLHTARQIAHRGALAYEPRDLVVLVFLDRTNEALDHARLHYSAKRAIEGLQYVQGTLAGTERSDPGILDELRTLAEAIEQPDDRSKALLMLAGQLVQVGRVDEAIELAADMTVTWHRDMAHQAAATKVAADGNVARVEELIAPIKDGGEKQLALAARVTALALAGRLEEAEQALSGVPGGEARNRAVSGLVAALAKAGQTEKAMDLARAVSIPHFGAILRLIVMIHDERRAPGGTGSRLLDKALEDTRETGDDVLRIINLAAIAGHLIDSGSTRADALLDELERRALSIEGEEQTYALPVMVTMLIGGRRIEAAERFARRIPHDSTRAAQLTAVATELARTDEGHARKLFTEALVIARSLDDDRRLALQGVALALARAGPSFRELAVDALNESVAIAQEERGTLGFALSLLARTLAERGYARQARAVEQSMDFDEHRARALFVVLEALAESGDVAEVEEEIGSFPEKYQVASSWIRVKALARAGRLDEARALVEAEPDVRRRSACTKGVVLGLAAAGRYEEAHDEIHAHGGIDGDIEAATLADLAVALERAGPEHRARARDLYNEALERARSLPRPPDPLEQETSDLFIVRLLAQGGHLAEAWQMASAMKKRGASFHDKRRPVYLEALLSVVRAAAQTGSYDRAVEWARVIGEGEGGSDALEACVMALSAVAAELALAGGEHGSRSSTLFDEARRLVNGLSDDRSLNKRRHRAFADECLATSLAKAGRFRDAFAVLTNCSHIDEYLQFLAVWIAQVGERDLAVRVMAEATHVAGWVRPRWAEVSRLMAAPASK